MFPNGEQMFFLIKILLAIVIWLFPLLVNQRQTRFPVHQKVKIAVILALQLNKCKTMFPNGEQMFRAC